MPTLFERRIFTRPEQLFEEAARRFAALASAVTRSKDSFTVALSGGSTPKAMYSLLASEYASLPWDKVYWFWGDERHVPSDHAESNFRMAQESLLSKVPVRPENIFRVPSENSNPENVAEAYERTLKTFFHLEQETPPRFDLILLGMGQEGHTASLFPGSRAVYERHRLVAANWVEKFQSYRITFTVPVLNAAANVVFMVIGKDKEHAVAAVFDEESKPEQVPAKLVNPPQGKLVWLLDRDAAGSLGEVD